MSTKGNKPRLLNTKRKPKNVHVTKSGQAIKIHRNLGERLQARRDAKARAKAARLAGLPKSRVKRILFRLHPKRMYRYWFSREGLIMGLKITGIGIVAGFLLLVGVFAYFRKDLPNIKDISGSNIGGSIRYYDKTGQTLLWEDYDGVKRVPVEDKNISQFVKDATVAVEDRDFFNHGGFDVRGIARAGVNDVLQRGTKQGGSTITQQLVKLNNDWTKDRTVKRKVKELILAVELERSYSKQEILTGYLNAAPYGNVQYGVEAASRDYFQKSAKDLTLDEATFLAAIPKSPSYYSPYGALYKEDPEIAKQDVKARQLFILGVMKELGKINQKQYDEAKAVDTLAKVKEPKQKLDGIKAPYFVLTAKEWLEANYGTETVNRSGWKITTTLDMSVQGIAEEQVQKGLRQVQRQGGDSIGFAVEDVKTGQMVALVGGVDFNNPTYGQNNYARLRLPPGSSIKPYDYAAMIDNNTNVGAGTVLFDTKGVLPGYPCTTGPTRTGNCAIDYDLRYPGPMTLRYALGGSRNIPAMKAMLSSDPDPEKSVNKTRDVIKRLMQSPGTEVGEARGDYNCYEDEAYTIEKQCFTAAAIGDGAYLKLDEHVHGYATLSRNGLNIPQTYILKIEDGSGKTLDEWKPSKGTQAVKPDTAYIVSDMISDPNASYLGSKPHRYKGWKFGYKTGTTNDSKDGWMMGMSTQYAAGVWVGYHNRTKVMSGFMENMTQPILSGFMNRAHESIKPVDRVKPAGIQTLPAFVVRSHVGVGSVEPSPANDLFPSWYKQTRASNEKKTIDQVSNKLATDCTPTRARKDSTDANANSFAVDRFIGGTASDTTQQDDIHKCDDTKPTIQVISAPSNCSGSCSITVQVTSGTHPISSAQFPGTILLTIDGQTVQSFPINDGQLGTPMNLAFTYSGTGAKQVNLTIVDSVLYDSNQETPITFGAAATPPTLSVNRPGGSSGSSATFTWTGGAPGTYTVYIKKNSVSSFSVACTTALLTCSESSLSSGGYTGYVQDTNGQQSTTVSF